MMATYKIINNDLWINEQGNHELFLNIQINDGTEIWNKAERVCKSDVDLVVADKTAIDVVATDLMNRAILMRPIEKINEERENLLRIEQIKLETAQLLTKNTSI